MVPDEPLLLAVAAERFEFSAFGPWIERAGPKLPGVRWSALARSDDGVFLLAANGAGRANAAQAVESASREHRLRAVISTGFAGGLAPELQAGDVFIAERVRQADPPQEWTAAGPALPENARACRGTLLTVDRVVQDVEEKAALRAAGADAVDMEASAVAAAARRLGLPFFCVRAISDGAATSFALDFNRARRADGTFSGWRAAAQAGLSPRRWRHLMQLRKQGLAASRSLAGFLRRARFPVEVR